MMGVGKLSDGGWLGANLNGSLASWASKQVSTAGRYHAAGKSCKNSSAPATGRYTTAGKSLDCIVRQGWHTHAVRVDCSTPGAGGAHATKR